MKIIHISDTHLDLSIPETFSRTEKLVNFINCIESEIDLVIHTGDIINFVSAACYDEAFNLFSKIKYPFYFCAGNHDIPEVVTDKLKENNNITFFPNSSSYYFKEKDFSFVMLDGVLPGEVCEGEIKKEDLISLTNFLEAADNKVVVYCHYPLVNIGVPLIYDKMKLINDNEVRNILVRFKSKISCCLFGHIHSNNYIVDNGIRYISSMGPYFKLNSLPESTLEDFTHDIIPNCNLIELDGDAVRVKNLIIEEK